ncbi:MAG: HAMP domain-containing sensor histidine kinase [Ruthenibacterium sp.]
MDEKAFSSAPEQKKMDQLALLAHEFKTPLSVTLSTLELLHKKMLQKSESYVEEYDVLFNIAVRNVYKVLRMANNFVDEGRLSCGMTTLHIAPANVTQLLRRAQESIMPMLKTRGASIGFICKAPELLQMELDAQAMERVVLNLVSNAIKHLPRENGRILISLTEEETQVRIHVTDNGSGISETMLPHIFERYWRDDTDDSVDKTGAGLGLYIVKLLVELHGGTVTVQSMPHIATTFEIILPRTSSELCESDTLRSTGACYGEDLYAQMLRQELPDFI